MKRHAAVPESPAPDIYSRFSELDVEQYRLDELDPSRRKAMDAALAADTTLCQAFQEELARLDQDDREVLSTHPLASSPLAGLPTQVPQGKTSRPVFRFNSPWMLGMASAAAACALVLGIVLAPLGNVSAGDTDQTRLKGVRTSGNPGASALAGELGLEIFLNRGSQAESIAPESILAENDTIQIAYRNPGYRHGMIFSLDGNGKLTLHYPSRSGDSTLLEGPGQVLLPYAYRLDGAPGFENFYFLAANQEFNPEQVMSGIQDLVNRRAWINPSQDIKRLIPAGSLQLSVFPLKKKS